MQIHDWSSANKGVFHDFHNAWIQSIKVALNQCLPSDYYALSEQDATGYVPDVIALHGPGSGNGHSNGTHSPNRPAGHGVALATAPPRVALRQTSEEERLTRKAKHIAVRHSSDHEIVAFVEIVSSGNKRSRNEINRFVRKSVDLIEAGVHLLVVDLFPPGPRDPNGIHGEIWNEFSDESFIQPDDTPLTLASYRAAERPEAFVEPTAVGQSLIDKPLFFDFEHYVPVPLDTTYMTAWDTVPAYWRDRIVGS